MKLLYRLLFSSLIFIYHSASAQVFDVDTLQYQGTSKNLVNLVILGDGYTADEMDKFIADANKFQEDFFSQAPFRQYSAYFNVFIVKVPSPESGVKHKHDALDCPTDTVIKKADYYPTTRFMPPADPDNYFGSSFDNSGLHRLVVTHRTDRISEVLKANVPEYSQTIILANSPYYGGSGGRSSTTTVNVASNNIAIHELGHGFANLADEYWPGLQFLSESTNRSQNANPDNIAWKNWIGTNGIGVYSYGGSAPQSVWFRPHEYCKMQYLVAPFCSVCTETIVETIHNLTNPVLKVYPDTIAPLSLDSVKIFSVKLAKPDPNTIKVEWFMNGKLISSNIDSIRINPGMFINGRNIITMIATDTTALVRVDGHAGHKSTVNWQIDNSHERELALPAVRWESMQTCYGSAVALSVSAPQSGIQYRWYKDTKKGKPLATGTNFVTPALKQETIYYLEAGLGRKKTARVPVTVKVLTEISTPAVITQELQGDTVMVSIANPDKEINYKWYLSPTDQKPIGGYYSRSTTSAKLDKGGLILKVPVKSEDQYYYVQAVSQTTSCSGKRTMVLVKGR